MIVKLEADTKYELQSESESESQCPGNFTVKTSIAVFDKSIVARSVLQNGRQSLEPSVLGLLHIYSPQSHNAPVS